jgi:hypothetical protein
MPITTETTPTIAEVCEILNAAALARIAVLETELAAALAERDAALAASTQTESNP